MTWSKFRTEDPQFCSDLWTSLLSGAREKYSNNYAENIRHHGAKSSLLGDQITGYLCIPDIKCNPLFYDLSIRYVIYCIVFSVAAVGCCTCLFAGKTHKNKVWECLSFIIVRDTHLAKLSTFSDFDKPYFETLHSLSFSWNNF